VEAFSRCRAASSGVVISALQHVFWLLFAVQAGSNLDLVVAPNLEGFS